LILLRFPAACSFASFAFLAKTVAELSQNPERSSGLSRGLVRGAIQPLQRLALHLQLHLRVPLSMATAVNDSGMVVGASTPANLPVHPFVWTKTDGMIDLTAPGKR
jgi:probable HAF family extracellular repeat protein